MKNRSRRIKRNMILAKLKEQCPYCNNNKIWASKTNVGKKCVSCKREIKHKIVVTEDRHKKLYNKLVVIVK